MRALLLLFLTGVIILPTALIGGSVEIGPKKATLSTTQTVSFDPSGVIQVERSFGDVEIQGWDRPEVEITTIRSTQQTYSEQDIPAAERDLNDIAITTVKQGEDRLKITTDFPAHSLVKGLHSKSNADLKYVIKAPAQAKIVVHHDIGHVNLINFKGDIEVTNRVGEIGLLLPNLAIYSVDARTKIGGIDSEVGCDSDENIVGQRVRGSATGAHPQLYLRIGVGDISIHKIKW